MELILYSIELRMLEFTKLLQGNQSYEITLEMYGRS